MPRKLLGHMQCPECDFDEAEVKEDKNGHPYRFCPDCNAQQFTRGDELRIANMFKKMRPVKSAAAPAPEQKPAAPARGAGTLLG